MNRYLRLIRTEDLSREDLGFLEQKHEAWQEEIALRRQERDRVLRHGAVAAVLMTFIDIVEKGKDDPELTWLALQAAAEDGRIALASPRQKRLEAQLAQRGGE